MPKSAGSKQGGQKQKCLLFFALCHLMFLRPAGQTHSDTVDRRVESVDPLVDSVDPPVDSVDPPVHSVAAGLS